MKMTKILIALTVAAGFAGASFAQGNAATPATPATPPAKSAAPATPAAPAATEAPKSDMKASTGKSHEGKKKAKKHPAPKAGEAPMTK